MLENHIHYYRKINPNNIQTIQLACKPVKPIIGCWVRGPYTLAWVQLDNRHALRNAEPSVSGYDASRTRLEFHDYTKNIKLEYFTLILFFSKNHISLIVIF